MPSTAAMPPRVSNAVPSMMRREYRDAGMARLLRDRRRAEIAADVEVLEEHLVLAALGAPDALRPDGVHFASGPLGDGDGEAPLHVVGKILSGDEPQHQLA